MLNKNISDIPQILLNEAIESLSYGLKYYDEYCLSTEISLIKQSITNFHRFIECTLKYFVSRINPLLVFTEIFKKPIKIEKDHVISFDNALTFYINNLEYGLLNIPFEIDTKALIFKLKRLKNLRNNITHWFIHPEEIKDIHERLSETIELVYYIYLEENISDEIHNNISSEELDTLNSLINTEKAKLKKAYQEVEDYIARMTSSDPKEQHPGEAPVFECPNCNNETLILTEPNESSFKCTFCKHEEEAKVCTECFVCAATRTPLCYLSTWNLENESLICEECLDFFESRCSKEE